MLTPEFIASISDRINIVADRVEVYVMQQIAKRLLARLEKGEGIYFTAYDKWQLQVLEESGKLYEEITQKLATYTGQGLAEIKKALIDSGITSVVNDVVPLNRQGVSWEVLFPGLGEVNPDNLSAAAKELLSRSPYYTRLMEQCYNASAGTWTNLVRSCAYAGSQRFIRACDKAYIKTTTGAVSFTKAIRDEVIALSNDRIQFVTNPETGHKDSIDVAISRSLRTGVSQMCAGITEARCEELDIDLVLVSAHLGARPEHEAWQGQVYSRSGATEKYKDFVTTTGYGTGEGLCGWNCRHSFSPFIEGMHNPYEENPVDSEESQERYKNEQKARAYERRIRAMKREAMILESSIRATTDEEAKIVLSEKLTVLRKKQIEVTQEYVAFCNEHDFRVMSERLVA